jgi:hypothetical protein
MMEREDRTKRPDPTEEDPSASSIHKEDDSLGESEDASSSVDRTIEEEDRQAEHAGESSAQQRQPDSST